MKKLKLVHIIQLLQTGGAEKLLVDLSINYKEKYDITVISLYKEGNYQYEKTLESNNIKIIYLNKKIGFDYKNFKDVYKILSFIKPDIIHTHLHAAIYAIPWYIKNNKKAVKVHTVHSIANMEFGKVHRIIQKWAYKFLKVIPVAISPTVKRSIIEEYKLKENKVPIVYNGINIAKYNLPKETSIKTKTFNIINVASFSKWKNQIFLLRCFNNALSKNKFMKLTFLGEGPEKVNVQKKAIEFGIEHKAEFIGVTDEVENFLNKSDVFILSSKFEGLPLSILEAYAASLPVISTDVGGVSDILINGENGFLVAADNEIEMEQAILKLYKDKELREKMGKINSEKVKKFDIKITTQEYINIYNLRYEGKDV